MAQTLRMRETKINYSPFFWVPKASGWEDADGSPRDSVSTMGGERSPRGKALLTWSWLVRSPGPCEAGVCSGLGGNQAELLLPPTAWLASAFFHLLLPPVFPFLLPLSFCLPSSLLSFLCECALSHYYVSMCMVQVCVCTHTCVLSHAHVCMCLCA